MSPRRRVLLLSGAGIATLGFVLPRGTRHGCVPALARQEIKASAGSVVDYDYPPPARGSEYSVSLDRKGLVC